jgi:hypothetical protein
MGHDAADIALSLAPQATPSITSKELTKFDSKIRQYRNLTLQFKANNKDGDRLWHATLEVRNMETQAIDWTRNYDYGMPVGWPAEDNRLVLAWNMRSDAAKAEMKKFPDLPRQLEAVKEKKKGLLLETVVPDTGAPLQQVVVPDADLKPGPRGANGATVSGRVVLVVGDHGNTAIYSITDGAKIGEFYGWPLATDATTGLIAAINRDDEVLFVEEQTGKELKRFTLGSPILAANFVALQKSLLVLTADQVLHRIPLPK